MSPPLPPNRHRGLPQAAARWAAKRHGYLDNLKVILVAAIIVGHAVAGYTRPGFWLYVEMREVTLSVVPAEIKAAAVAGGAVLVSFWLARLLIDHVRGMAQIL